ncbi:hypothetical protein HAX54_052757 [Datura stramonium]|uniref:AMP-binding enzyme C-terminal domain-containing protein n=1 Tax=Datura stramonium TaxID=4076 RepID=A0ABS8WSK4_DATST|nr:hypothetical protein [Datura stramonium]
MGIWKSKTDANVIISGGENISSVEESAILKHPYVVEASHTVGRTCRGSWYQEVQFVEELPKTGTGKVQKNHLREVAKTFVVTENANQRSKKSSQVSREKPRAYDQSHEQILALSRL